MKKKFVSLNNQLNYLREKRKYLHSTDIFETILHINKKKNLNDLNILFKKPIFNETKVLIQNKYSEVLKIKCSSYFEYQINRKQFFGFIIELKKKLNKTKSYKEDKIKNKTTLFKDKIKVPNVKEFNFIELISASAMKFLKKKSPELKSKWYLAKIFLFKFSYNGLFIRNNLILKINKIKSTIYNFDLYLKEKKIGSIIFMKT